MKDYRVIGLMSGTSLDGVDAALVRTDGETHLEREAFYCLPYPAPLREKIRALLGKEPDPAVERELTEVHAQAVKNLLLQEKLTPKDIDLVGFHGQTITHAPERGYTCQLGDGALLARLVGIDVMNDFRTEDVKAGGQGAPLAPLYHQTIANSLEKPVAFLNIGGVANVTYLGLKGDILAFDTGPGNALLDDWMLQKTGKACDENGETAKAGKIDALVLNQLLSHPFFARRPPKSLDRNAFISAAWKDLSLEDGAATLAAFTVRSVVKALDFMPDKPKRWIVCGGGRLNKAFMESLEKEIGAPVAPIESLGLNGDSTEAEAFAYLAIRSLRGLHLTFPTTTGVKQPMQGGTLHPYIAIPDDMRDEMSGVA